MKEFKQPYKIASIAFVFLMLINFAACDSNDDEDITKEPEPTETETPTEPEETETPPEIVVSDLFKSDAGGWTIVGDAQGGFVEASWSEDGGVTDGYIFAEDDVIGGVWYFSAPQSYKGDKSSYYGATLSFSLYQESSFSKQFEYEDIIFTSGDKRFFYKHASTNDFPKRDWTDYSITINADTLGWFVGKYKDKYNGPELDYEKATEAEMKEVLSDITEFLIRGEFEVGIDTGGLDDVFITKE